MKIIIQPNGDSNIEEIKCFNPEGSSYCYVGKEAKELIKSLHEALVEDFVENKKK